MFQAISAPPSFAGRSPYPPSNGLWKEIKKERMDHTENMRFLGVVSFEEAHVLIVPVSKSGFVGGFIMGRWCAT